MPAALPYLAASSDRVASWPRRLAPTDPERGDLKVGVCWRGSRLGDRKGLSFTIDDLRPLARIPAVRLISLQKSDRPDIRARLAAQDEIELLLDRADLSEEAFEETAALIEACDLVISCDTAIAHLAGALGRPT